jgi:hypothetical protein
MILSSLLFGGKLTHMDATYSASSRHPASEAMLELRKAMGKTQTMFAVEVLNMAVSTVARFETSTPPEGDMLLKLAEVALDNDQEELYERFRKLYKNWMVEQAKRLTRISVVRRSPGSHRAKFEQEQYRILELHGSEQSKAADNFELMLSWLKTGDAKQKATAERILKPLIESRSSKE